MRTHGRAGFPISLLVLSGKMTGKLQHKKLGNVRFAKLKALSCFQEVHKRLAGGSTLASVAKFVQHDRGEYTSVSEASLMAVLSEYRSSLAPSEKLPSNSPPMQKAAKRLESGLDELAELERLYAIQMERLYIDFGTEKKIGKLIPTMTQEVRVAREILDNYAKLKMDLGLTEKHLGKAEVEVNVAAELTAKYGGSVVQKVIDNPASGRKVLAIAERFLALSAPTNTIFPEEGVESDTEPDTDPCPQPLDPGDAPDEPEAPPPHLPPVA